MPSSFGTADLTDVLKIASEVAWLLCRLWCPPYVNCDSMGGLCNFAARTRSTSSLGCHLYRLCVRPPAVGAPLLRSASLLDPSLSHSLSLSLSLFFSLNGKMATVASAVRRSQGLGAAKWCRCRHGGAGLWWSSLSYVGTLQGRGLRQAMPGNVHTRPLSCNAAACCSLSMRRCHTDRSDGGPMPQVVNLQNSQ